MIPHIGNLGVQTSFKRWGHPNTLIQTKQEEYA